MIYPKHLLKEKGVVKDYIGESQFQPAGIDLTLKDIYEFKTAGRIDFDNKERKISEVERIEYENDWVFLRKGAYKVVFNEYVNIPPNTIAIAMPRSSLLRSGITMETAVWDPGYHGRSEALLVVHNENGAHLKRNAKIAQLVFIELKEKANELYEGVYKGENK